MDMGMMMGGGDGSMGPLNASGVDFANETQAFNFLQEILDDSVFQVSAIVYARYFWYGTAVVIGISAIFNLIQKATMSQRIKAAAADRLLPALPSNVSMRAIATVTAIFREISYPQFSPTRTTSWFKVPPVGTTILIAVYLAFVLALQFIQDHVQGAQYYTALGVRAGWLAVAQVPLLVLLAGKNNLVGLVTGVSYERLNVLHRWAARGLLLLATIHFGVQSYGWAKYGLMQLEWKTDACPPTGIAAYALLLWLNLSTLAPFRNFSYEFFVVQHILTFFGFIIAIMYHLPDTSLYSRVYIYIPIGLYFLDRVIRTARYAYNNVRPGRATLEAMEGGVTKIRVQNKQIKNWAPGAFVLLSIPKFGPGQSHPATIASIPSSHDHDLVFILKGHRGFTNRLLQHGISSTTSLPTTSDEKGTSQASMRQETYTALIDGPYGGCHQDFAAFDTVVLISGSTGITYTLPVLLDIAARASRQKLPVRHLQFVWIIKNTSWTSWISNELISAFDSLEAAGIQVAFKIHVTCDENFAGSTDDLTQKVECGCECDKSLGPCCCVNIDEEEIDVEAEKSRTQQPLLSNPITDAEKKTTANTTVPVPSSKPSSLQQNRRQQRSIFTCCKFDSGRPSIYTLLWDLADQAEGEMGIAVCGPMGLSTTVRTNVAKISDERAVHKGSGAQGIYLHCEGFGW